MIVSQNQSKRLTLQTLLVLALTISLVRAVPCQDQVARPSDNQKILPAFSVVSVRPSEPGGRGAYTITADALTARNVTLNWLILPAYGIQDFQRVLGAPKWMGEEDYDVLAKADSSVDLTKISIEERGLMLRSVLEDRFKLKAHFETREFQEFKLTLMKGGPKFKASEPTGPEDSGRLRWMISGRYKLEAHNATMVALCALLYGETHNYMVADETGLTGKYDFNLSWSRVNLNADANANASATEDAPEIFRAVKEQLGLQLVPRKVMGKVLVIDSAERPSAN